MSRRKTYKRRSHQRSLPTSWFNDEPFLQSQEKFLQGEFLRSINIAKSIPKASVAIPFQRITEPFKSFYFGRSIVSSSLPEKSYLNRKFQSYDISSTIISASSSNALYKEPVSFVNDIHHQLKSRLSEPSLFLRHGFRDKNNYFVYPTKNPTDMKPKNIDNRFNIIVLKSSYSDENLTAKLNVDRRNCNCNVQYSNKPLLFPLDSYPHDFSEKSDYSCINSRFIHRRLPKIPFRQRNAQSLYLPTFNTIHSKDFKQDYSTDQSVLSQFSKRYSNYDSQNESLALRRSYSLATADQNIKVEYNNDTSWANKNFQKIPLENKYESKDNLIQPRRERSYSREKLKLDLKIYNKPVMSSLIHKSNDIERKSAFEVKTTEMKRSDSKATNDDEYAKLDDSIGSIINNVRSQLLLSHVSDDEKNEKSQTQEDRRNSIKIEFEGKVVSPKICALQNEKYTCKRAILGDEKNVEQNVFQKCRSRSSQGSSKSDGIDEETDPVDDVFESNASSSCLIKDLKKLKLDKSSLDSKYEKFNACNYSAESRISVSINKTPEYFEYNSPIKLIKSIKNASSVNIAKLNSKQSDGSLKKSSKLQKNSSSDFERRSRHLESVHRESFKKNDRTNERNSEQDRDTIEREHKDGNLNRSLSNTDTNLEDRIGKF